MLKEAVLGPSSKTMNPSFEEQLGVDCSKLQAKKKTSDAVMLIPYKLLDHVFISIDNCQWFRALSFARP